MIYSKQELWQLIQTEVESLGYQLFDIDMPCSKKGVVRVFIAQPVVAKEVGTQEGGNGSATEAGIAIDDCVSVARQLNSLPALDELREKYSLEVSSPGVNRKLKSLDHFLGAVGERIKLTYFAEASEDSGKTDTVRAHLAGVEGDELSLLVEPLAEKRIVKFEQVHKAQVDFMFDEVK